MQSADLRQMILHVGVEKKRNKIDVNTLVLNYNVYESPISVHNTIKQLFKHIIRIKNCLFVRKGNSQRRNDLIKLIQRAAEPTKLIKCA